MAKQWLNRREFLGKSAAASLALGLAGTTAQAYEAQEERPVRIGFVGTGNRGTGLLGTLMAVGGVEIPALCDINPEHLDRAVKVVEGGWGESRIFTAAGLRTTCAFASAATWMRW